jgi:uncharacterized protein (TIGR00730 family)
MNPNDPEARHESADSPLSAQKINKNIYDHIKEIGKEFKAGFETLRRYPATVTIFGSARVKPDSFHYEETAKLAGKIVRELGLTIVTGGGPGTMEAAAKGAVLAGGKALGLTIQLPRGQITNKYVTESCDFKYFFIRKAMLTFSSHAFVFFPGGYGTLDELADLLNLIQGEKIPRVPIILVGMDYWTKFADFLRTAMVKDHHTIEESEMNIFTITDDLNKVIEIIKSVRSAGWWNVMD